MTLETVDAASEWLAHHREQQWLILGEGSNTAFIDDYDGTVVKIHITGKKVVQTEHDFLISVGAGENWHELVTYSLQHHMYGLENLALIPGSVGAAPIQNIGAYGVEVASFIDSVECLDVTTGQKQVKTTQQCQFGYRDSLFKRDWRNRLLICTVTFRLPKKWQAVTNYGELAELDNPGPQTIFNKVVSIRQSKLPDPAITGNAGSFFKNPIIPVALYHDIASRYPQCPVFAVDNERVKIPAAWLIDTLGFKGKQHGGIHCHARQPLVLTNDGNGNGKQLLELARLIRDSVLSEFGIMLENEVQLIGKQGALTL